MKEVGSPTEAFDTSYDTAWPTLSGSGRKRGKTRHPFVKHHDEAPSVPPFSPSWPGQEPPHVTSPEQPAPSAHTDEPANEAPKEPASKVTAGAETAKSREEECSISSAVATFLRAGKDGGGQEECGKPTSGTSEAAPGIAEPPKKLSTESHDKAEQRTCICGPKTKILLLTVAGVTLVIIATAVVTAVKNSSPRDDPVISGHFGAVRGQRLVVSDQDHQWTVHAFLGVPFAKAPRGELRFKPPQPLTAPVGKDQREDSVTRTLDTWTKRPPCPQQDFYLGHLAVNTSNATEDCLHLNIWAPPSSCGATEEQEACQLRTVLFFLYGAAFQNGGNNFEARPHALRRPIPVRPWQPGRGRAELPRRSAGLSRQPRGDEFSRKLGPARPAAGARMDARQHRLLRRQRVASSAGGPRRRRDVPGLPPVQRRHGVLDAGRGSLHTPERRTLPQLRRTERGRSPSADRQPALPRRHVVRGDARLPPESARGCDRPKSYRAQFRASLRQGAASETSAAGCAGQVYQGDRSQGEAVPAGSRGVRGRLPVVRRAAPHGRGRPAADRHPATGPQGGPALAERLGRTSRPHPSRALAERHGHQPEPGPRTQNLPGGRWGHPGSVPDVRARRAAVRVAQPGARVRARLPAQLLQLAQRDRRRPLRRHGARVRHAAEARRGVQRPGQSLVAHHDPRVGNVRANRPAACCAQYELAQVRLHPAYHNEAGSPRRHRANRNEADALQPYARHQCAVMSDFTLECEVAFTLYYMLFTFFLISGLP
ncbi:uncharacterized protein [Dermacentor albipictus]|uniref:uncharacterized protein isoform X2 n=1 Tax=Dermacentor albipictus TaxID=60249 RepID=UPI0038FC6710